MLAGTKVRGLFFIDLVEVERSANVLYAEFVKIDQCKHGGVLMLFSCGPFLSFHFLYFLYSKSTVGINAIHQPSPLIYDHPELPALLTLAPTHVLVTRVQKNPSLFMLFALYDFVSFSMLFVEGVQPCSMPSLSFAGWLPTAMHAFYLHCNQQNPVNPQKERDLLLSPHLGWIHCLQNKKETTFCCIEWEIS